MCNNVDVMLNIDCNDWLSVGTNYNTSCEEIVNYGEKQLLEYLNYKDTGVTDILINVNADISFYPSKTVMSIMDKYFVKEELGKVVDYSKIPILKLAYEVWVNKKLDVFKIWIDACRKAGIRPWLSFRMNDIHDTPDDFIPNYLKSDFFYKHYKDYTIRRHIDYSDWFARGFDYSILEVRQRMLNYISETLDRYDTDGIELDFQRESFNFASGKEEAGREILLGFLAEVKEIVNKAEIKYGHKIKIGMRCLPKPEDNIQLGIDVGEIARRGLVDLVVPSSRGGNTCYDFPIILWKQVIGDNVDLACGIEDMVVTNHLNEPVGEAYRTGFHTLETLAACAQNFVSQGVNKVYLFNYYNYPNKLYTNERTDLFIGKKHNSELEIKQDYLSLLSSRERLLKEPRKHVITYEEFVPLWRDNEKFLPKSSLNKNNVRHVRVVTGDIAQGSDVILKLGVSTDNGEKLKVYLNGEKLNLIGIQSKCGLPNFTKSKLYCFKVNNTNNMPKVQIVEFVTSEEMVEVDHVEIDVNIPFKNN